MWGIKGPILLDPDARARERARRARRADERRRRLRRHRPRVRRGAARRAREGDRRPIREVDQGSCSARRRRPRRASGSRRSSGRSSCSSRSGRRRHRSPGAQDVDFGAEAVRLSEGLAELGELVSCRVEQEPAGFPLFPMISVRPEGRDVGVRYDGLPWGYELGSLVGAIVEAGRAEPSQRPESVDALAALEARARARRLRHADLTALPAGRAAGVPVRTRLSTASRRRRKSRRTSSRSSRRRWRYGRCRASRSTACRSGTGPCRSRSSCAGSCQRARARRNKFFFFF